MEKARVTLIFSPPEIKKSDDHDQIFTFFFYAHYDILVFYGFLLHLATCISPLPLPSIPPFPFMVKAE